MLVLARQEGDGITFPDLNLEVEVLRIQGSRVQLGIHAPRELTVLRSELIPVPTRHSNHCDIGDSEKAIALQQRLRELSTALAIAKTQCERGDIEGVERTLRTMVSRAKAPEKTNLPVPVETHVSEVRATYQCSTACKPLQAIPADCPLRDDTRNLEGLAC